MKMVIFNQELILSKWKFIKHCFQFLNALEAILLLLFKYLSNNIQR